jgi:hypothetical protein
MGFLREGKTHPIFASQLISATTAKRATAAILASPRNAMQGADFL